MNLMKNKVKVMTELISACILEMVVKCKPAEVRGACTEVIMAALSVLLSTYL